MMKKKEIAETLALNTDINEEKKSINDNEHTNRVEEENQILSKNTEIKSKVEDNHIKQELIKEENTIEEENSNVIDINNNSDSKQSLSSEITETKDINVSKIIIKKVEKQETPKRITYYLKPETIKKIDKFSKMAGMGKSEFVQTLLDEVLNNLEIEK